MLGLKVTAPVLQPHCWGAADPSPPWHAWSGTERARVREAQGGWMGVERQECEEEKRPGEKKKRITTLPFCSGFAIQKKSASTRRRRKKKAKKCGAQWSNMIERVPLRCSLFTSTIKVQWCHSTHIWLNVVKCSHPFPVPPQSLSEASCLSLV